MHRSGEQANWDCKAAHVTAGLLRECNCSRLPVERRTDLSELIKKPLYGAYTAWQDFAVLNCIGCY